MIWLTRLSLRKRTQVLRIPAFRRMTAAAARLKYVLSSHNGVDTWELELVSRNCQLDSSLRCLNDSLDSAVVFILKVWNCLTKIDISTQKSDLFPARFTPTEGRHCAEYSAVRSMQRVSVT